ncbi:MAG: NUDIX domain-containing protein [Candidatus Microsaccharimonas sp.]
MTRPRIGSSGKVFLVNAKRELLVLTISEYKARPDRSFKPDFPGGLVDAGESELIAVQRELMEEAGIHLEQDAFELVYAGTDFYAAENVSFTKCMYIAFVDETPEVTISWEHSAYEWVPVDKVLETIELRPFLYEALEYCLKNKLI